MSPEPETAFSRAATRSEKLTIVPPLTIRQTESLARDIQALADLHGMEKSEYIRHLVIQDKKHQHEIWSARNQLFVGTAGSSTDTEHDDVRPGS